MKHPLVKRTSDLEEASITTAAHELAPAELDSVHGGALNIEVPAYVPLSQSHPKTEVVIPRTPYK